MAPVVVQHSNRNIENDNMKIQQLETTTVNRNWPKRWPVKKQFQINRRLKHIKRTKLGEFKMQRVRREIQIGWWNLCFEWHRLRSITARTILKMTQ